MTITFNKLRHDSHSFRKEMTFNSVLVNKELAQRLLDINTANRPVRARNITQYIKDLKNGTWSFTGQTIVISKTGRILDGQHRLLAIEAADVPMKLHIQTGILDEAYTKIDIGAPRSAADTLATIGYKHYGLVGTVAKVIRTIQGKKVLDTALKDKFGNQATMELVQSFDKERIEEAASVGSSTKKKGQFLDVAMLAALWYILTENGLEEKANTFLHLLGSGENLGPATNSSIYLLRAKLINNQTDSSKLTQNAKLIHLINTWNAWYKGRTLKRLPPIDGEMPDIVI